MLRRLDNGGEPIEPTVPYLMVTCRSRFLDGLRSERRRRRRREEQVTRAAVGADLIDVDNASAEQAIAALATLTDIQRAAIVLRFVDDLRVDDVARHLDRSVRATESLLVHARQALRDGFSEEIDA